MSGGSMDTAPFHRAVRDLQAASRGTYAGPAVPEQSLQTALSSTDGLDTGALMTHVRSAVGDTQVGQLRNRLLPLVLRFLGQAASGAIGGLLSDVATDWFDRRNESEQLADEAGEATEVVDQVVEDSDAALNAVLIRATQLLDVLLKYLGTVDPHEHPEQFMAAVRNAATVIDSTGEMITGTCEERDSIISECYDHLLDRGQAICQQPCAELPPEVAECEPTAPPADGGVPTSPATSPPPVTEGTPPEKAPTPKPGSPPEPETPPEKKPEPEPDPEPEPTPEDCPPAPEDCAPEPAPAPSPAPVPEPTDCPPQDAPEPLPQPAPIPEPAPVPDPGTTPAATSPGGTPPPAPEPEPVPGPTIESDPTPEPEPVPGPEAVDCLPEEGAGEECPPSTSECCSGVLGLLGVGVAILGIGLLIECLEDMETPPAEAPEQEPIPEPEPEPAPAVEPEIDLSTVPEPDPPPKKLINTESVQMAPPIPEPASEPPPPAPAPEPPAPAPDLPPAPAPAPEPPPESDSVGTARKAGAW